MPRNKLTDLNDHLFEQLERLNDEQLKGDNLTAEINRSRAVSTVASQIINAAKVTVDAMKLIKQEGASESEMPLIFGDQKKAILN